MVTTAALIISYSSMTKQLQLSVIRLGSDEDLEAAMEQERTSEATTAAKRY